MTLYRIKLGSYIVIGILLVFGFRLWQLQILDGDKYKRLSEDNRLRILKTPAPRGIIYDRNETPLVKNIPFFSVSITTDNPKKIDIDSLSALLGLKRQEVEEKLYRKDNSPFVPIKLKQGLSFGEIARIEAGRSDFPGLFVETDVGREYLFGKVGAHIIGYLGKITQSQMKNPGLRHFPPDALIGQWGVEALHDAQLRGIPGERIIEVDALGRELRLIQERPSVKGNDVSLSIDINIQKAVEDSFRSKAGALVALKPDTGEILAFESLPSFDPNTFSRGIVYEDWKALMDDKKKPMLNRAVQSQYPPGSTFKIITAIAALEEGVIHSETKVICTGGINFGKWTFGCWKKGGHGSVDFHKGIVESCDVYFYELGKRLGMDRIYKYADAFGLGRETGIDLVPVKERQGLIPNTEWKKEKKRIPWYLGDTFISAIGQGYVTTTPIQMAVMMSTFANGGTVYKPTLIKGEHRPVGAIKLKPDTIEMIKDALSGVINESNGTAQGARSSLTVIGGKTGTAQVVGKKKGAVAERFMDHAWFVAFAPVDKPEIALSVFVEHGGGGGAVAAPIAKKAIEAYMKSKNGQEAAAKSMTHGSQPIGGQKDAEN
ncbi:MAG: penicillin-binding protein 2 [Nitrospirae bacterium GWC2_46_6]|nr:MAG: penicillin-binding protein 2 [Nitrospirae bacterium GWC2_46_6]OGW22191.1 MAG: penicillin-binding protein 2 [Nitrospirae bacterium GWA2_46_11]OGW23576.1 MAG: penicillin-binding protein 2 [Nitrospirae bacterium GWB2_47_37]